MRISLPRSWRVWLPCCLLLAGGFLFLLSRPERIPSAFSAAAVEAASPRVPWSKGGAVRVGAPEPVRQATVISPYGPGFEFELVAGFCEQEPCTPEWVNVADKEEGFAMLRRGEIDILVGFWGDGPGDASAAAVTDAERTPLPEEEDGPGFEPGSEPGFEPDAGPPIRAGKAYGHFNPIRISGTELPLTPSSSPTFFAPAPSAPPPSRREASSSRPAGKALSPLESLSRAFTVLIPAREEPAAENGGELPSPVFSFVMDGNGDNAEDILLLDPASYALWLPFMGEVSTKQAKRKTPYRWFWRDDGSLLASRLEWYWDRPELQEELAELTERYFGFLPRALRQQDILELAEALNSRLPLYEKFIMNAARETGVPPLLLVAAIYQESRFDPDAVSETRVRGIMQLTTATAQMLNVDRKDPEQCIMGGARYLRDLWDRIGDKAVNDWDRWFMALAAYNQGMSNLNRTIKLAQELGAKGDTWADLKQVFPLSTTCRGLEAKSFVERIRYYNFILHGLVALAPAEAEDFAPLLGLAVADGGF